MRHAAPATLPLPQPALVLPDLAELRRALRDHADRTYGPDGWDTAAIVCRVRGEPRPESIMVTNTR